LAVLQYVILYREKKTEKFQRIGQQVRSNLWKILEIIGCHTCRAATFFIYTYGLVGYCLEQVEMSNMMI
jgi:hypothetical protein